MLSRTFVNRNPDPDTYNEPFPIQQIFYSSKPKDLADDNFKSDDNGRKFSKQAENNVGKGEIAHHEQFLLFPQCFQMISTTYN